MRTLLHILIGTERGGCERDCFMVCRELSSVKHEALVIEKPGSMSADLTEIGTRVTHLNLPHGQWRNYIEGVRNYVRDHPPAGVILWHGMIALPQLLFALRDLDVPIVVHGGNPAHTLPRWVDWKFRLMDGWYRTPRLPTYVCCSNFVALSFEHSSYLRRFPRRVVLNGAPPMAYDQTREPRRFVPGQPFTLGMLARLDAIKDHETLLRAFAVVARRYPEARLELAGDGDLRETLEALCRELALEKSVKFLGMVRNVYDVMVNWDIFVYSTTENEGMGNALAEAMMVTLPCIATDIAPIREVAGEPPAILLAPKNDPDLLAQRVMQVIESYDLRRQLSASARDRAEEAFSSKAFAMNYGKVLWPGFIDA